MTPFTFRKAIMQAKAELSGDVATDIPARASGSAPHRVRLFVTPRAPAPPPARGVFAQIARDLSDRSESGDPRALITKYGAGLVPLAMSIPFTAVGVVALIFLPRQAPHQVLPWVFGAIFSLSGIFLFTMGLSGLRTAAAGKVRPEKEKEPWRSDNRWNSNGARPDAPGSSFAGVLGATLFLLLIGAFNVMWTVRKDFSAWVVVTIVLVVFDSLGLLMIGSLLVAIVQRIRAGSPRLSWRKFPFFTGEPFEASFASGRGLHVTGPVRTVLRCVEQVTGEDKEGRPEVQPYAIYAETKTFEPPGARLSTFDVSFAVPASLPGTDLSKEKSTYWLLEVRAPLAGPDFSTQFLIPIYSRPSGGR